MDTKNENKIPKCGSLPNFSRDKVVVGSKQLRKALLGGRVRYVFLAENADPAVTGPIRELCEEHHIQITWIRSMTDLGRACGIDVGAAAAAVVA